jgi:hypothetical protein
VSDPVAYTAVLPVAQETVLFVSRLLAAQRRPMRYARPARALGCNRQAVLILRWLVNGTRLAQLAADNRIGRSTADDIAAHIIPACDTDIGQTYLRPTLSTWRSAQ